MYDKSMWLLIICTIWIQVTTFNLVFCECCGIHRGAIFCCTETDNCTSSDCPDSSNSHPENDCHDTKLSSFLSLKVDIQQTIIISTLNLLSSIPMHTFISFCLNPRIKLHHHSKSLLQQKTLLLI